MVNGNKGTHAWLVTWFQKHHVKSEDSKIQVQGLELYEISDLPIPYDEIVLLREHLSIVTKMISEKTKQSFIDSKGEMTDIPREAIVKASELFPQEKRIEEDFHYWTHLIQLEKSLKDWYENPDYQYVEDEMWYLSAI